MWPSPVSTPSYRCCATDIVRFGLKLRLRLASCCRVEVVNGGAGDRFCVRDADLGDDRMGLRDGLDVARRRVDVADVERLAIDAHELGGEPLAALRLEDRLDRPVLARDEAA